MPSYTNPKFVHVEPRGAVPVGPVIVLGVIGYAAYRVAEWIASVIVAIEIGAAVLTLGAVAALALVLRRQRGRVVRPGTVPLQRVRTSLERHGEARAALPAVVHLHVLGSSEELSALFAQQQPGNAIERP